ncbi:MAG: 23S rRNA (pseudouridine(1915)-N(3))-methyltransferase RlmH, partial [Prevotellaceae bacterium]|nr:23S rRNA (pseudouridine(1915)-N(3))-methyltransferase RlmH [Prevotellaceae bacterium]
MKIALLFIGKTEKGYLPAAVAAYVARVARYAPVEVKVVPEPKNVGSMSEHEQKKREGELILSMAGEGELLLLDERGKEFSSEEFSAFLSKKMQGSTKQLTFAVGGPYGFSDEVYRQAVGKISLSRMTFSHQ